MLIGLAKIGKDSSYEITKLVKKEERLYKIEETKCVKCLLQKKIV